MHMQDELGKSWSREKTSRAMKGGIQSHTTVDGHAMLTLIQNMYGTSRRQLLVQSYNSSSMNSTINKKKFKKK